MRRASSYFFRIFFVYNFEYLKNEDDMDFEKLTFFKHLYFDREEIYA